MVGVGVPQLDGERAERILAKSELSMGVQSALSRVRSLTGGV